MKKINQIFNRWNRLPRWLRFTLIIILSVVILGRLALPTILKDYVNHKLHRANGYDGSVGSITVHLWRGAYRIHKININQTSGKVSEPFFEADFVDLSIEWLQLFHGVIVGKVYMMEPKIHFVAGPTAAQSQTGKGGDWDKLLNDLFPFSLNSLETVDGEVYFNNHYSKPPVAVFLKELNMVATNLTNVENQKEELPARVQAKAKTIGGGLIDVQIKVNLLTPQPTFELNANMNAMDLSAVNQFIQAYGGFQADKGFLSLYTSVASKNGAYDGYVKVFFKDLHIFIWEKERKKDIFQIFKDVLVGGVGVILTNPNGNLAAKVPISGAYGKSQVGTWEAVGSVIQNAFIRVLLPKLDEKVTIQTVEKKHPAPAKTKTSK